MNQRQIKKYKKKLALLYLEKIVCMLDEDGGKYKAHVLRTPSAEVRTIKRLNGYRIEIRSTREDNHNYAHFHVVKGTDGMASIRIDTLESCKQKSIAEMKKVPQNLRDRKRA